MNKQLLIREIEESFKSFKKILENPPNTQTKKLDELLKILCKYKVEISIKLQHIYINPIMSLPAVWAFCTMCECMSRCITLNCKHYICNNCMQLIERMKFPEYFSKDQIICPNCFGITPYQPKISTQKKIAFCANGCKQPHEGKTCEQYKKE